MNGNASNLVCVLTPCMLNAAAMHVHRQAGVRVGMQVSKSPLTVESAAVSFSVSKKVSNTKLTTASSRVRLLMRFMFGVGEGPGPGDSGHMY